MAKDGKAKKAFSKNGENFAKDEIIPLTDYSITYPIPPIFEKIQTQCAGTKNAKKIEFTIDEVGVENP